MRWGVMEVRDEDLVVEESGHGVDGLLLLRAWT